MVGDIERLLTGLSEAGVRYLVAGGVAVVLHGYLRATADLDLIVTLDPANVENLLGIFERMGFQPRAPVALRAYLPFDDALRRASWARLGDVDVPVAAIDDLIAIKRIAGRPRDREDIEALLALKKAK